MVLCPIGMHFQNTDSMIRLLRTSGWHPKTTNPQAWAFLGTQPCVTILASHSWSQPWWAPSIFWFLGFVYSSDVFEKMWTWESMILSNTFTRVIEKNKSIIIRILKIAESSTALAIWQDDKTSQVIICTIQNSASVTLELKLKFMR